MLVEPLLYFVTDGGPCVRNKGLSLESSLIFVQSHYSENFRTSRTRSRSVNNTLQEEDVDGIMSERLLKLYRSRTGHAGHVNRRFREYMTSVEQELDETTQKCRFASLNFALCEFEAAHEEYVNLATVHDPDKVSEVVHSYKEIMKRVKSSEIMFDVTCHNKEADENVHVKPSDSVSQCGSRVSSTSSARARAASKKAALKAKLSYLNKERELEYEQLQNENERKQAMLDLEANLARKKKETDLKLKQLRLHADIAAASAEETALDEMETEEPAKKNREPPLGVHDVEVNLPPRGPAAVTTNKMRPARNLNPYASIWSPPTQTAEPNTMTGWNVVSPWNDVTPSHSAQGGLQQQQILDFINLPKTTIMTFDGDPLKFCAFASSFDSTVGNSSVDDRVKLNCLLEYCSGKAAQVIMPCTLMSPTEGYHRARELLKKRFGNAYRISLAWVDKVTKGPEIRAKDAVAMQDLADDLRVCVETLRAVGSLDQINSRSSISSIVERLPMFLRSKWRKIAVDELESNGAYPGIERLATFIDRIALEVNDPVFGSLEVNRPTKKPEGQKRVKHSNFNVQVKMQQSSVKPRPNSNVKRSNDGKGGCPACSEDHGLATCKRFASFTAEKRLDVVKEGRVCFCCLGRNHVTKFCKRKTECGLEGCTRTHSRLLHFAFKGKEKIGKKQDVHPAERQTVEGNSFAVQSKAVEGNTLLVIRTRVVM